MTVSEIPLLKALTVTYLSASVAGNAIVGIIPQAFVGPCNRLLLMISVGKHNGGQARSAKQAVEHDCDAAESQSTTGPTEAGIDIIAALSRRYRKGCGAGSGGRMDVVMALNDGYPLLLGKRALEQAHDLLHATVACSKRQCRLGPLCEAGHSSWNHG